MAATRKRKATAGSITWTGKNLAEVRKFWRNVKHYPERGQPHYRDWTQHPDNLHVTTPEGHTVILEPGDSLTREATGRLGVRKAAKPRAPRALRPVPPSAGQVHHVTASETRRRRAAAQRPEGANDE
jgi:hypothetical protein